ncbi:alpha/beta fold hydrolase [Lichenihabitans psoromatis]|uniref:alpha/beta fold hydrolase n=1 Tax=Lichenihabitans psoromatis TaxID=2528642 RepID=UPI0010385CC8|nr:alpha/beta hydrolase [Lichenihabitans psoromatis]
MTKATRKVAMIGMGAAALALALWRRDIPFSVLDRRYADDSSRWQTLPNGLRLHYRDIGPVDAPVLVCVHGYSASSLDWLPWAERLKSTYRLLLIDLPGHGLTAAPDSYEPSLLGMVACVAALMEALSLARVVLIGNSMGGQVAATYALANPDRIAGLVLVASIGAAEPVSTTPASPPFVVRLLGSAIARFALRHIDLTPLVRHGLRNAFGDREAVTDALVRQYTDLARAPGHREILTGLQIGQRDTAMLARLPLFDRPTLVMSGDADRLVPVAQARAIAAALPRARLIVYPGIGHVPMQQIPERSAADLRDWLAAGPDSPFRPSRPR